MSSSATLAIVGCVAVDFKTVVHVASAATFALKMVLARLALTALKKLQVGSVCPSMLFRHACCMIYNCLKV